MDDDRPWSDRYRVAGEEWCDAEAAASLLEDAKSAVMAQKQVEMGDIPVNRAEQAVKASPFWSQYIRDVVEARKKANLAKVNLEVMRMGFAENQSKEANQRTEMRMLGETT